MRACAQVADIAHAPAEQAQLAEALQARAHVAAAAKAAIELDRNAAAEEAGYVTGLFKVLGAAEMAKNDLIVGVPGQGWGEAQEGSLKGLDGERGGAWSEATAALREALAAAADCGAATANAAAADEGVKCK
jgi:hypothetical protein